MPPNEYGFFYAADYAAILNGGNQAQQIRIESGANFVVQAIHLAANLSAAHIVMSRSNIVGLGTTVALESTANFEKVPLATGPKLARDGIANFSAASGASLTDVNIMISQGDRQWMNVPIRADLICGEPGKLFLLPTPIVIRGNTQLLITLYNNLSAIVAGITGPTIDAQVVLAGYKQTAA